MRRRSLNVNARLFVNDTVETSAGAKLQIRLDDGSELLLSENAHLVLDEFILDRQNVQRTSFAMRVIRGLCRVITGVIAEVNPERFLVHSRLSTIGIRGCDVCIKPATENEEIYILGLAPQKMVRVEATSDGSALRNILTGKAIPIEAARRAVMDVTEPQTMIVLGPGRSPETKPMPGDKFREIVRETSPLPAARYEALQKPDGAVLMLHPDGGKSPASARPRPPQ